MATSRLVVVPAVLVDDGTGSTWRLTAHGPSRRDEPLSVGWRLVASNHRELGRGTGGHSVSELLDWLGSLQRNGHRLEPVVATRPERPGWAWRAVLDGAAVATSGRTYQRQREAAYSYQQFAVHLPAAVVDDRLLQQVLRGRSRRRASCVR